MDCQKLLELQSGIYTLEQLNADAITIRNCMPKIVFKRFISFNGREVVLGDFYDKQKEKNLNTEKNSTPMAKEKEKEEEKELDEIELKAPQIGERFEGIVTSIKRGKLGDFINVEAIRNEAVRQRLLNKIDRDAIQICFTSDYGDGCQTFIVSLSPNSNYAKLAKKYKKLRVGDKIELEIGQRGFPRIAL